MSLIDKYLKTKSDSKSTKSFSFNEKQFLNKSTIAKISAIGIIIKRDEGDRWIESEFRISDCSRSICLDLDVGDENKLEETLYKLKVIKNTCNKAIKFIKENKETILFKEKEDGNKE